MSNALEHPVLCRFEVVGFEPAPKGSWTPTRNTRTGKLGVRPSCQRTKPYGHLLRIAARDAWGLQQPLAFAVGVVVTFVVSRPEDHYRTSRGRRTREVKASRLGLEPIVEPDLDKLQRAVGDALSKVVIVDDAQITGWIPTKRYVGSHEQPGTYIAVHGIG